MDLNDKITQFLIEQYKEVKAQWKDPDFNKGGLQQKTDALIDALGRSNHEDAEELLIQEFKNANEYERPRLYMALGRIGGDEVAKILIDELEADNNRNEDIFQAVGMTASPIAIEFMMNKIKSGKGRDREIIWAIQALGIANK